MRARSLGKQPVADDGYPERWDTPWRAARINKFEAEYTFSRSRVIFVVAVCFRLLFCFRRRRRFFVNVIYVAQERVCRPLW